MRSRRHPLHSGNPHYRRVRIARISATLDPGNRAGHDRRQHALPRIATGRQAADLPLSKPCCGSGSSVRPEIDLTRDTPTVGISGVTIDFLVLRSTFAAVLGDGHRGFSESIRRRRCSLEPCSSMRRAAVMATEPVVRGRAEQVSGGRTVVVFGTLAFPVHSDI